MVKNTPDRILPGAASALLDASKMVDPDVGDLLHQAISLINQATAKQRGVLGVSTMPPIEPSGEDPIAAFAAMFGNNSGSLGRQLFSPSAESEDGIPHPEDHAVEPAPVDGSPQHQMARARSKGRRPGPGLMLADKFGHGKNIVQL
jgi:hypothetical protein